MTASIYTLNSGAQGVEEARLISQHKLLLDTTKTLIPDDIAKHLKSLTHRAAVADIGTGTGIWLRDLATQLHPGARLDGFDIETTKFPRPDQLPVNVHLARGDALEPFSEKLLGQYDLVHVRLLMFGLKADEWEQVAANLLTLLRPGGYLMWDETGYPFINCMPMTVNFQKWISTEVRFAASVGRDYTSPMHLKAQVQRAGFVDCRHQDFFTYGEPRETQAAVGHATIRAARQSLRGIVDRGGFEWVSTHEDVDRHCDEMEDEVARDVCTMGCGFRWVVGRSP